MSLVYFVRCPRADSVKIGMVSSPARLARRIYELQVWASGPLSLEAVVPGDADVERSLQCAWDHRRLSGEWFDDRNQMVSAAAAIGMVPDSLAVVDAIQPLPGGQKRVQASDDAWETLPAISEVSGSDAAAIDALFSAHVRAAQLEAWNFKAFLTQLRPWFADDTATVGDALRALAAAYDQERAA